MVSPIVEIYAYALYEDLNKKLERIVKQNPDDFKDKLISAIEETKNEIEGFGVQFGLKVSEKSEKAFELMVESIIKDAEVYKANLEACEMPLRVMN